MLLNTLSASLLGHLLKGEWGKAKIPRRGVIRAGQETISIFNAV